MKWRNRSNPPRRSSISIGLGVAAAAIVLETSRTLNGEPAVSLSDFHIAFFVFALVTLGATMVSARLPRDAGAELSGHVLAGERAPAQQS